MPTDNSSESLHLLYKLHSCCLQTLFILILTLRFKRQHKGTQRWDGRNTWLRRVTVIFFSSCAGSASRANIANEAYLCVLKECLVREIASRAQDVCVCVKIQYSTDTL